MSLTRQHYYLGTALVYYKKENENRSRLMNLIFNSDSKKVTGFALSEAREALIQRLSAENNVSPEDVLDFVLSNVSYLGYMTEGQFLGKNPDFKEPTYQ